MVLPAPAPDDAPRATGPAWLARLSGILGLAKQGVLVLVDDAHPARLGELVRSLLPAHPDVEVHTDATKLPRVEPGSLVILVPDPTQATWLNLERPLFANRALRAILFSDGETSRVLARRAPDFFSWISHRIECPEGPPVPAVHGLRAALRFRAPGVVWRGGDLESVFRAALPGRDLKLNSAAIPYVQLVEAARPVGRDWVAWTDIDSVLRMRRVRWALAEAGRRGRTVLVEPALEASGFMPVHARELRGIDARTQLEQAGAKHPGRLAALLELEPEAVNLAGALLRAGVAEATIEVTALAAVDPGVALARMAAERGIEIQAVLLARMGQREETARNAVEELLRSRKAGGARWVQAAEAVMNAGDVEVALLWARRGLADAPGDARALFVAGRALQRAGQFEEAAALLRRAIAGQETTLGVEHPAYGASLQALAAVLQAQAKYADAEAMLRRSLAIQEKALGVDHPDYGTSLHNLAGILQAQGKYSDAEATLRRSLAIKASALGVDHPTYGASLHALAGVLESEGRYAEAEALLRQALAVKEKVLGIDHPDYGATLHALASVLASAGKYAEAEALLRRALALKEKALGVDHLDYGASLHALAGVLETQGRYADAEALIRQALAITERALGVDHPDYGASLHALAGVLQAEGRYAAAEGLLRRVLAIAEKALGVGHPDYGAALQALAGVLESEGNFGEAEALLRRALAIDEKALGANHPSYGAVLHALGGVLASEGKYAEAEALLRRSREVAEKALGHEHPSYAASLHALAGVLRSEGKYAEAEALLHESRAVVEKSLGVSHPDYGASLHALASVHQLQGKYAEADALLRTALALREKSLGIDHPSLYPTLINLAGAIARQGDAVAGEPFAARALRIAESVHGSQHPDIARILARLAEFQADRGGSAARVTAARALEMLNATLGADHPATRNAAPRLQRIASGAAPTETSIDDEVREGITALSAGDPHRAARLLGPVLDRARGGGRPALEASACGLLAWALFLSGEKKDEALSHARRALELAEAASQDVASAQLRELLATIESADAPLVPFESLLKSAADQAGSGDPGGACAKLADLAGHAQREGALAAEASARMLLGQLLLTLRERARADAELRRALVIAEELPDLAAAARIRELLATADGSNHQD